MLTKCKNRQDKIKAKFRDDNSLYFYNGENHNTIAELHPAWVGGVSLTILSNIQCTCYYILEETMETETEFDEIELRPDSVVENLGDCRFRIDGRTILFRIRKLTPRECLRLMGVDDKDIDTIQSTGISNSAQYKLAGNSIVVDNLYHIFRTLFIEQDKPENGEQMTIF